MYAVQATQVAAGTGARVLVANVQRVHDWLVRECPECHRQGYVSIYPNREVEALNFILRLDWLCKSCADIRCEVERNFYGRGVDSVVN